MTRLKLDNMLCIAIVASLFIGGAITVALFLASLLGWSVIFVIVTLCLVPFMHSFVKICDEENVLDLDDAAEVAKRILFESNDDEDINYSYSSLDD